MTSVARPRQPGAATTSPTAWPAAASPSSYATNAVSSSLSRTAWTRCSASRSPTTARMRQDLTTDPPRGPQHLYPSQLAGDHRLLGAHAQPLPQCRGLLLPPEPASSTPRSPGRSQPFLALDVEQLPVGGLVRGDRHGPRGPNSSDSASATYAGSYTGMEPEALYRAELASAPPRWPRPGPAPRPAPTTAPSRGGPCPRCCRCARCRA